MSSKKGDVTSVDELEKILSSLQTQAATDPIGPKGSAQPLSSEALERLAAKINELLGEDSNLQEEQAVNEDGLPVFELNEPVSSVLSDNRPSEFAYELQPLRNSPQDEAERLARQRERDAFLDALEEEERLEQEEEESEFLKVVRETKDRLQDVQTDENTRRNAKLQEILGDADKDEEYKPGQNPTQQSSASESSKGKEKGKGKSVSFADDSKPEQREEVSRKKSTSIWGDVQQARLQASLGPKAGEGIMKLNIVERFPSVLKDSQQDASADSDDEDGSEDEDEDEMDQRERKLATEDEFIDDEDDEVQKEMDDEIQYKEIAHRYHQQRQALGSGPSGGALGGNKNLRQENPWDHEEVPLEATLASEKPMTKSQFMAARISTHSLNAALPRGVEGEVKQGKIIGGHLADEDSDDLSDDSIGERGRRIIEGLKKGLTVEQVLANEPTNEDPEEPSPLPQIQELEPQGTALVKESFQPPIIKSGSALVNDVREVGERKTVSKPVVEKPVKVSRFKANRMG